MSSQKGVEKYLEKRILGDVEDHLLFSSNALSKLYFYNRAKYERYYDLVNKIFGKFHTKEVD